MLVLVLDDLSSPQSVQRARAGAREAVPVRSMPGHEKVDEISSKEEGRQGDFGFDLLTSTFWSEKGKFVVDFFPCLENPLRFTPRDGP